MTPTTTQMLTAMNTAVKKGYKLSDDLGILQTYQNCIEYLWENKPLQLPLIRGQYYEGVLSWEDPDGTEREYRGELPYLNNRYEHTHQTSDGKCWLVVG